MSEVYLNEMWKCTTFECRVNEYIVYDWRNSICPRCQQRGRKLSAVILK